MISPFRKDGMERKLFLLLAVCFTTSCMTYAQMLPTKTCANGEPRYYCSFMICMFSSCNTYPNAGCQVDICGQCKARFYNGSGATATEVTDKCGNTPQDTCTKGRRQCPSNPCGTCPRYPKAECLIDNCGGCQDRWFLRGTEVTDECKGSIACQNGGQQVQCSQNCPLGRMCPGVPKAQCRPDVCNGCTDQWFVDKMDVTAHCNNPNRCGPNPCYNGGTCISLPNAFRCLCVEGTTGPECQIFDRCLQNPCQNGGQCANTQLDYTCTCPVGFTGKNCQFFDRCLQNPCQNGGQCANTQLDYTCTCPVGFTGKNCQFEAKCRFGKLFPDRMCDPTIPNTCPNTFQCTVPAGGSMGRCCLTETANLCTTGNPLLENGDAKECQGNGATPCPPTHECKFSMESTKLVAVCCPLKQIKQVVLAPCVNKQQRQNCPSHQCASPNCMAVPSAECVIDECGGCFERWHYGTQDVTFLCPQPGSAVCANNLPVQTCQQIPCEGKTCLRVPGAKCWNDKCGGCFARWYFNGKELSAKDCEVIDYCQGNPCSNGGQCTNTATGFQCTCTLGYSGQRCEVVDYCHINPCLNNGTCISSATTYTCDCLSRFNGTHCEIVDLCSNVTCLNGRNCTQNTSTYQCTCAIGYGGDNCEQYNACYSNPCISGGQCIQTGASYQCQCPAGFAGKNCGMMDYCTNNPCLNGGRCENTPTTYQCTCLPGFTGINCQNTDYCYNVTCRNQGVCINEPTRFICNCTSGFTGTYCQTNIQSPAYIKCDYGRLVIGQSTVSCASGPIPCPPKFYCQRSLGYTQCCLKPENNLCGPGVNPLRYDADARGCLGPYSSPCPSTHTCKSIVDPNVSVCCPKKAKAVCVNGLERTTCSQNLCDGLTCPSDPYARCVIDNCGGCRTRWFNNTHEVSCTANIPLACAYEEFLVNCPYNLCETSICRGAKTAECKFDRCGGCNARWFVGGYDVTRFCANDDRCGATNPCLNGGSCVSHESKYQCFCAEGYSGANCETSTICQPNPCLNGGACRDKGGTYGCDCKIGFTGANCGTPIPQSALTYHTCPYGHLMAGSTGQAVTCSLGAYCPPEYECSAAQAGQTGHCCRKKEHNLCAHMDLPYQSNGGARSCQGPQLCPLDHTCVSNNPQAPSTSVCCPKRPPGYVGCINGKTRQTCPEHHCKNDMCRVPGSKCVVDACGGCYERWFIKHFEVSGYCKGIIPGTCVNNDKYMSCNSQLCSATSSCGGVKNAQCKADYCGGCFERWYAGHLEVTDKCKNPDQCQANPCQNNGICVSLATTYQCVCIANFVGAHCEVEDFCKGIECKNGGTCQNLATAGKCMCPAGFVGESCEHVDYCMTNPCENQGICMNTPTDFTCQCFDPYTGRNCSEVIPKLPHEKCLYGHQMNGTEKLMCTYSYDTCGRRFQCKADRNGAPSACCLEQRYKLCGNNNPMQVAGDALTCHANKPCPPNHICKSSFNSQQPVSVCCPVHTDAQGNKAPITTSTLLPPNAKCRYGLHYNELMIAPSCLQNNFYCPHGYQCRGESRSRSVYGVCCLQENPCPRGRPHYNGRFAVHCLGAFAEKCPANHECQGTIDHSVCCRTTWRDRCSNKHNCQVDRCKIEFCPNYPGAKCFMDNCGKCKTRWQFEGNEFTDKCGKNRCPAGQIEKPACDPCLNKICTAVPGAVCAFHRCGEKGCTRMWFLNMKDVTAQCEI